jgi:hypothetical protein
MAEFRTLGEVGTRAEPRLLVLARHGAEFCALWAGSAWAVVREEAAAWDALLLEFARQEPAWAMGLCTGFILLLITGLMWGRRGRAT